MSARKTSFTPEYIERLRADLLARNEAVIMLERRVTHSEAAVRLVRNQNRRLRRVIEDLLDEFAGYRDNNNEEDRAWGEPKPMQRARELLKEKAR